MHRRSIEVTIEGKVHFATEPSIEQPYLPRSNHRAPYLKRTCNAPASKLHAPAPKLHYSYNVVAPNTKIDFY